jgi:hypothetical protein
MNIVKRFGLLGQDQVMKCVGGKKQNRNMIKAALLMPSIFYGRVIIGDNYEMYIYGCAELRVSRERHR